MTKRSSDWDAWNQDSNPPRNGASLWTRKPRIPNKPVAQVVLLLIAGITVFIFGELIAKALLDLFFLGAVLAAIIIWARTLPLPHPKCRHCHHTIVPRVVFCGGEPSHSICPFCGKLYKSFSESER